MHFLHQIKQKYQKNNTMAKPVPGDIEYAYNRVYIVVNPDPSSGPPTYRVSNPDDLSWPGGGSLAEPYMILMEKLQSQ